MSSLPNLLAITRIVLAPLVIWLTIESGGEGALAIAAVVFGVAAASDFLDGWVARKWNLASEMGVFLDGTADKLLVSGALLGLLMIDRVSVWAVFIILGREFAVVTLRGLGAMNGAVMPPSKAGKVKANLQFLAILLALLRDGERLGGLFLDEWAMWLAVLVTLWSGWGYLKPFLKAKPRLR
jgi:CDP-diacylglycerol--glycerol-3-phosphate 3-phosphatidyltransferase